MADMLIAVSLYKNVKQTLDVKVNPESSIEMLTGIRSLSMAWIIVFHTNLKTRQFWGKTISITITHHDCQELPRKECLQQTYISTAITHKL